MNCNIFKKEEEKFDINILNEQTERITGSNIFHVQAQFSGFTSKLLALITFNLQPHAMYWDKEDDPSRASRFYDMYVEKVADLKKEHLNVSSNPVMDNGSYKDIINPNLTITST